jgi:alkylation response protein AidB-like acyl-CoA dehydrogenase
MNLALSEEQELLREAARGMLARHGTVAAARAALDGAAPPDLWPAAVEAGWPGLLVGEAHGGAGLDAFDAMLVLEECGRVLAPVPLLGHLPASALLDRAGHGAAAAVAAGQWRAAWLPVRPPGDGDAAWTVERRSGAGRAAPPTASAGGPATVVLDGLVPWVPDAVGADVLVAIGTGEDGAPVAAVLDAGQSGVAIEPCPRYDATRALGHVRLDGARGEALGVDAAAIARAWYLAQALLAAESLGATEAALEMAVAHARERFTFGRPIGSYQAIKHALTEVLRRADNTRSLLMYAGWADAGAPAEFPLAASAARSAAGRALDLAARQNIVTHGGIGATWEHDAPLYFRRAQLTRRLLGGNAAAADRVAGAIFAQARATG